MNKVTITKEELKKLNEGYSATCQLSSLGVWRNTYPIEVEVEE